MNDTFASDEKISYVSHEIEDSNYDDSDDSKSNDNFSDFDINGKLKIDTNIIDQLINVKIDKTTIGRILESEK